MVLKPSEKEQEFFLKKEAERIQKLREEHQRELAKEEREKRKKLHYMHCPKCGMDLTTSDLAGVEIDVCPDCKGVYLDAGELDKILEGNRRSKVLDTISTVRRFLKGQAG